MLTHSSIFTFAALLPLVTLATCSTQAQSTSTHKPKTATGLEWMSVKWDQSDAPYIKIRRSIEGDLKKGVSPEKIMLRYDSQHWLDAKLTFGYLVAAYERARRAKFALDSTKALPDGPGANLSPLYRLQLLFGVGADGQLLFPHSAEFSRIAFLWWCNGAQGYSRLHPVAKRLVAHYPKDFDVKWWAFQSVIYGENKPNPQLLLKWADDLHKQRPRASSIGILKPMVYYTTWGVTHSPADEKKAISAFRHFLATVPANDPQRKEAEFRLSLIPVRKKIWAKQAAKAKRAATG